MSVARVIHNRAAPVAWTRAGRWLAAIIASIGIAQALLLIRAVWDFDGIPWGLDFTLYVERAASWLAGDGFYLPRQLAGPYSIAHGDAMYPPIALWLFVPFTVLPAVLWWVIPAGLLVAAYRRQGLSRWAPLAFALILLYQRAWIVVILGNPSMWAIACGVAGVAFGWPALGAIIKPVFAPLALTGIRRRSWWFGAVVVCLIAVPFGSMWIDYAHALQNAQGGGLEYVVGEWPIALALLVAMRRR